LPKAVPETDANPLSLVGCEGVGKWGRKSPLSSPSHTLLPFGQLTPVVAVIKEVTDGWGY